MRNLEWILAAVVLAAFLSPLACEAQAADSAELQDYAQRDAGSVDLEDFAGGHSGVVLAIVLIAAVVVLVALLVPW